MIELLSDINVKRLVIKEAHPKMGVAELFKRMSQANKTRGDIVQAFDYNSVINRTHLFGAYINAVMAFSDHSNRAKSPSMEMLLFAAMTDQIGDAIEALGINENSKIVVFSNSKAGFDKIKQTLNDIADFRPTKLHESKALERFGMRYSKDADRLLLQRMAMSRLKL